MDLPSKAYQLLDSIDELVHELELWELTRSEDNQQAAQGIVSALTQGLAQIANLLAAPESHPTMLARASREPDGPHALAQTESPARLPSRRT